MVASAFVGQLLQIEIHTVVKSFFLVELEHDTAGGIALPACNQHLIAKCRPTVIVESLAADAVVFFLVILRHIAIGKQPFRRIADSFQVSHALSYLQQTFLPGLNSAMLSAVYPSDSLQAERLGFVEAGFV